MYTNKVNEPDLDISVSEEREDSGLPTENGTDQWRLGRAAVQCYRNQDFRGALQLYEQLLELNPKSVWFALQRGQCLFKLHRYHESLQQLQQAESMGCADPLLYYWLGKAWFELKSYAEAITALHRMLEQNPKHLRSRFLLLRAYQFSGQRGEAERQYAYLLALQGLAPEFQRHLGKTAYSLGDFQTARYLVEGVLETPSFCHAGNYHLLAQILLQLGEDETALTYLELALQERRDGFLLKDYGVLLLQRKRYDEARAIFTELEKERKYGATGRYYLALTSEGVGAYQEAAASYREVLKRNPRHLYAALKLASILERQRKTEEALQVLRGIVVFQQNNTGLHSRIRALEKEQTARKEEYSVLE